VFSYPIFKDYRDQNTVFSGLLAFTRTQFDLSADNRTEQVTGEYVSGNYFDVLGIKAARGRTFLPEEDQTPGTQPVAVISESFRRKQFGADRDPLGQKITVNGLRTSRA
jgi:hypothetical protein